MNATPQRRNLLIFVARAPAPGAAKTRLGRTIGMAPAARLYRAFLADLDARFRAAAHDDRVAEPFDLCWAFTPEARDVPNLLVEFGPAAAASNGHVRVRLQEGDDLGARQANLLRWAHELGYERALVTASDSPHLPVDLIRQAFAVLADHEVTIGRVHDGGYYLLGLRGFRDVLAGVPMSVGRVADGVVARCRGRGLRVAELPCTFDVDEAADLDLLIEHLSPDGDAAPATWAALRELDLVAKPGFEVVSGIKIEAPG
jgi:rSAM/selenodomain-associated transferase 1